MSTQHKNTKSHLPLNLKSEEIQCHTCTFGYRWKRNDFKIWKDHKDLVLDESKQWKWVDEDGLTHGRLRLLSSLGRFRNGPSPFEYHHHHLSKNTIKYEKPIIDTKESVKSMDDTFPPLSFSFMKKSSIPVKPSTAPANISSSSSSYNYNNNQQNELSITEKWNQTRDITRLTSYNQNKSIPKIRPKSAAAASSSLSSSLSSPSSPSPTLPRQTLNRQTLEVISSYMPKLFYDPIPENTPGPGQYDPIIPSRTTRHVSILQLLPNEKKTEPECRSVLPYDVAPGFNYLSRINRKIGFHEMKNSSSKLIYDSWKEEKVLCVKKKTFVEKKAYGNYISDYSFPKKQYRRIAVKGTRNISTVQNYVNQYKKLSSTGAHMKF